MAIKGAKGPDIDMYWGRSEGKCTKPIGCTRNQVKTEGKCKEELFNKVLSPTGILLKGFEPEKLRKIWEDFGFSPEEQVALQGSHTFGNVNQCAGGFNGVEKGT